MHIDRHVEGERFERLCRFRCQWLRRGIGCVAAHGQNDWIRLTAGPDSSQPCALLDERSVGTDFTMCCLLKKKKKHPFPFSPSVYSFCCLSFLLQWVSVLLSNSCHPSFLLFSLIIIIHFFTHPNAPRLCLTILSSIIPLSYS